MTIKTEIKGVPELLKKIQGLSYDAKYKGGRFALRKAAQVIRNQVRINAKSLDDKATPEDISANIVERWNSRRYKSTGELAFRIGVLGGARQPKKTIGELQDNTNAGGVTYYWRFLEFGTEKMAARPFMRPSVEQSAQRATDTFIDQFNKSVDRTIKKGGK